MYDVKILFYKFICDDNNNNKYVRMENQNFNGFFKYPNLCIK